MDGRSGRRQAGAHDVRARQHEFDGPHVSAQLLHHIWVLVQQAQRGEPGPIPLCKEQRRAVHYNHLQMVRPACEQCFDKVQEAFNPCTQLPNSLNRPYDAGSAQLCNHSRLLLWEDLLDSACLFQQWV